MTIGGGQNYTSFGSDLPNRRTIGKAGAWLKLCSSATRSVLLNALRQNRSKPNVLFVRSTLDDLGLDAWELRKEQTDHMTPDTFSNSHGMAVKICYTLRLTTLSA